MDLNTSITLFVSVLVAIIASSGFWSYMTFRHSKNNTANSMMKGLGHDRITFLGMQYLKRGWITKDEYENLYEYLFKPYRELGGNGTAEKIMEEVKRLPMKQ